MYTNGVLMMEDTNSIVENPEKVREAEIIVGTPSYNEVDTISNVTATADLGLRKYFADKKAVIINADNHSCDGTKDAFFDTRTKTPKIFRPPRVSKARAGTAAICFEQQRS